MIDKIISYVKGCCKENEEGKRKRKVVFATGLIILFCKVFFNFFYKINKFYYYSFGGRFSKTKTFILIIGGLFILLGFLNIGFNFNIN